MSTPTTLSADGLQIGEIISRKGQHGDVYEGFDRVHNRVAVKILKRGSLEDIIAFTHREHKFIAEGQNLAKAQHPNVVRVYYVGRTDVGQTVLVTEFCDGGSLDKLVEDGPTGLKRSRKILTDAGAGIRSLHNAGMIHRDIKPGNILLDSKGIARIADFGLVDDISLTGIGRPNVYFQHKAPECFLTLGHPGVGSVLSDIWAFGATTYRLISGDEAWKALGTIHMLVPLGGFAKRLAWAPHIPRKWRQFVLNCLEDDPTNRYQTMTEVQNALSQLPVTPEWAFTSTPTRDTWVHRVGSRIHEVTHDKSSPSKQSWEALNKPVSGQGRMNTMGRSQGTISPKEAINELTAWFESYKH